MVFPTGSSCLGQVDEGSVVEYLVAGPDSSLYAGVNMPGLPIHYALYRSTDQGSSWLDLDAGLPEYPILEGLFTDGIKYTYISFESDYVEAVFRLGTKDTVWSKVAQLGNGFHSAAVSDSARLILVGSSVICRSTDHGDSWQQTYVAYDTPSVEYGIVYSLAIGKTGSIIGSIGGLYAPTWMVRSTNDGLDWTRLFYGHATYDQLAVNPVTGSMMGLGQSPSPGLYRSTDEGETWSLTDSSLAGDYFFSIAFDATGKLYACGPGGVFVSSDEGVNWLDITQNLPSPHIVRCLTIGLDNHLYVGTVTSGVWKSVQTIPAENGGWENALRVTSIDNRAPSTPIRFELYQNYPNPFNPTTTIRYALATNAFVSLRIYDVLGREVKRLVNERQKIGKHSAQFDARNLPSGVYFFRLQAGTFTDTKKLTVLK